MEANYNDYEVRNKFYHTTSWKKKRKQIIDRDNGECQLCRREGKLTIDTGQLNRNGRKKNALIVHHIKELEHHPDLKLDDRNLLTVCFEHHERIHGRWQLNKPKPNKWKSDERW